MRRTGRLRRARSNAGGSRSRAPRPDPDAPRGAHLSLHGPLDVRRRERHLSHEGGARRVHEARSDHAAPHAHAGARRAHRRRAAAAGCGAQGIGAGCLGLRRQEPGAATRVALRGCLRRYHQRFDESGNRRRLTPFTVHRSPSFMAVITYRDALNQALREEMQRDDRVFLIGEEVGVYQGAYKVSKGLLQEFGEMRVVDTPITELGFAGVGVGAAMVGLRPIVEFMTWNFAVLALDQVLNSASKMLYMSGGQYNVPIVFRGPNGAALQLSAQHSQAFESWLAHVPGPKVVTPGTPYDAKGLLKSAIRDDNPVLFLEGEMLYNTKGEVPDEEYLIPIGKADLKRKGDACSIITNGKMALVAMNAADQLAKDGIHVDVVDLRTIRPMDVEAVYSSVQKTNRAVVLEEGWELAGIGAQVVDYIQRDCFDFLDAPVIRVHQADVPMPYAKNLERAAKPDVAKTIAAVRKVMYLD